MEKGEVTARAPWGLHWFRRDLRVQGNPALLWSADQFEGRVLGVFFFDSKFLARPDFSHARFAFFLETLDALREELRARGGDLLVLDALPSVGFPKVLRAVEKAGGQKPGAISFNRDYEPFARERDAAVTRMLSEDEQIPVHTERDHLLVEPHELKKGEGGGFYQVYTPFSRRWFNLLNAPKFAPDFRQRIETSLRWPKSFALRWNDLLSGDVTPSDALHDALDEFKTQNARHVTISIPKAGSVAAKKCLAAFREKLHAYKDQRDLPAVRGTSQISIFLKNGSLSVAQVIAELAIGHESITSENGPTRFLKELAWREFYYHILWHCPRVEHEAFLERYRSIPWENREDLFDAWKAGKTGYPMIDAGMRQLAETGWMHNRVRMIVASFLVKDLHIDWRWGERYFMEKLLDGDLAPNNGGWQWAASTGCDPQPYFRVFNPTLQSEKFDPEGEYIRRWVPERAGQRGKDVHAPIDPIVDHASRKVKALTLYKGR